ncbi:hypothetical protein A8709_25505 [Paenibacillus pectinilyticus]|uniref:Transmembrane protein n=1 Tax=Paenibacillus pectinilyticus TaxID=512399 RepID=A0A1C1A0Y5_9BACL|nr:hypothetical protein [Paenibacillus pectinilyticus]OCT14193.1 hypothetical protein A8709_25505 [Paenibacillus pectinilyticus]
MVIRIWQFLLRKMSPAAFAAIGVFLITVFALFIPPYIGMADNGDYARILNGLYVKDPTYVSQYFGYFIKTYGIFQNFNENSASIFSTQSFFIKTATLLNQLFHPNTDTFDIRYQAGMYLILYTTAIYLFTEALTWKMSNKLGYLVATVVIFILGDTGYTAYFNSFYGESVVLIMSVFMVAFGLLLYRKRYNDYLMIVLFVLSAIVLTASKQQNAPVGIIVAIIGIFFVYIRKRGMYRIVTTTLLISLLCVGVGTYVLIPKEFVNINKYHAMTRGVLMVTDNPEKTLESFGIDKQFAILKESEYFDAYTMIDLDSELLQTEFYNKYGFGSILKYYVLHPTQAGQMLNLAARDGFSIRPHAMGSYEKSVGKPFGAQTKFFSGYSLLKDNFTPKTFGFVLIWILIIIGLYMPSFITALRKKLWRNAIRLPLIVMLIGIGLSGIFVSIIGAGDADLAKHEFLFTLIFDLVSLMTLVDLFAKRLWIQEEVESESEPRIVQGVGGVMHA